MWTQTCIFQLFSTKPQKTKHTYISRIPRHKMLITFSLRNMHPVSLGKYGTDFLGKCGIDSLWRCNPISSKHIARSPREPWFDFFGKQGPIVSGSMCQFLRGAWRKRFRMRSQFFANVTFLLDLISFQNSSVPPIFRMSRFSRSHVFLEFLGTHSFTLAREDRQGSSIDLDHAKKWSFASTLLWECWHRLPR